MALFYFSTPNSFRSFLSPSSSCLLDKTFLELHCLSAKMLICLDLSSSQKLDFIHILHKNITIFLLNSLPLKRIRQPMVDVGKQNIFSHKCALDVFQSRGS